MHSALAERRIGEFARRVRRMNDAGTDFPPLSVTKDRGIVLQSEKYHKRIATDPRKYLVARPGEFVYDAMSLYYGSIGRVTQSEPGLVSPDYVLFDVDDSVDHEFLQHVFRSDILHDTYERLAEGGNLHGKRRRIYWSVFESITVRLPPLDEQRRIATALSAVDRHIVAAERCYAATQLLLRALADHFVESTGAEWIALEDVLVEGPTNGRSPVAKATPPGVPTFSIAAVRDGTVRIRDHLKFADVTAEAVTAARVVQGDVLIVRGNANPDLVATCGMVREAPPADCIYPDILMRVRPDTQKLDADYLVTVWNSGRVHADLLLRAKTTNGTYKVNGRDVAVTQIPLPDLDEQQRVTRTVRAIRQRAEREAEALDALRRTKSAISGRLLRRVT